MRSWRLMGLRRRFYERAYRTGATRWDSGVTPPEVVAHVDDVAPGRALDLGCGTGTNALFLAKRGWRVVGVDFSEIAIDRARQKTAGTAGSDITLIHGDVTRLEALGVSGTFDLVLDIGCFHGIPVGRRDDYVRGVAEHTRPGAILLMFAFPMGFRLRRSTLEAQIRRRFEPAFALERVDPGTRPNGAAWFTLRRR